MFEYPAMILGVIGAWLVARKNRWGFMLWIIGNGLWIVFGFINRHWGVVIQFSIFWGLALYGWINWRTENGTSKEN